MKNSIREIDVLFDERKAREPTFIADGAVDVNRYALAHPRILWILKEANGPGDWDLRDYFRDGLFTYPKWYATAALMIKVSHGLLNSALEWGDWSANARSLADCLRDVAIININKRGGESRSKWEDLDQASTDFADLVAAQISALQAHIVILAGSYYFCPAALREKLNAIEGSQHHAMIVDGTLFINAYHPGQSTISHEEYYNGIVAAVRAQPCTLHTGCVTMR